MLSLSKLNTFSNEILNIIALTGMLFVFFIDILIFGAIICVNSLDSILKKIYFPKIVNLEISPILIIIFYAISWLWRIFALKKGLFYGTHLATQMEISSYGNIIGLLNNLGFLLFIGIIVFNKKNKKFIIFIILEFLWGVLTASKSAIFYTLLPTLLILFHQKKIKINFKLIFIFLCIGILIFYSFIFIQLYRMQSQSIIHKSGTASLSPFLIIKSIDLTNISYESVFLLIFERINLAKPLAQLIEYRRIYDLPLWWGKSLFPIFTWYIPRFIWAQKPSTSIGAWFGREILGWDYDSRSEAAITIWGDSYLNFGEVGILFLPIIWLFIVYFIYHYSLLKDKMGLFFIGSTYVRIIMSIEQNFSNSIVYIITMFILVFIVIIFLTFSTNLIQLVFKSNIKLFYD
ncbi:MAG: O-antigen polymerase [Candidatus Helarchaeota archaeon]